MSGKSGRIQRSVIGLSGALLALTVAFILGCSSARERSDSVSAVLRVGSDLSNPPFAFVDEAGDPAGLEVEMMRALGRVLALELKWHRLEFAELLDAVEAGRIDVACATLGVSPERAQRVDFSSPYYQTSLAVVVRTGDQEPNSIDDLARARVAASEGTTSEAAVRTQLPSAIWSFGEKDDAPVAGRLLAGEIDAAVMDFPSAQALVAANPNLRVLPEPLAEERYALAIHKRNRQLQVLINAALRNLGEKGELPSSGGDR